MMKSLRTLGIAATLCATTCAGSAAQAVTFNLIDTGGAAPGTQARSVFDIGAAYWSSVLKGDFTLNVEIGYATLGDGVIGETSETSAAQSVENVYGHLLSRATTALDRQAVAHLSPLSASGGVTTWVAGYTDPATRAGVDPDTRRLGADGSVNTTQLSVTTANLKALGFTTDLDGQDITHAVDASIVLSSHLPAVFDPTNGYPVPALDFVGTVVHELGHALGFTSGVDMYDYFAGSGAADLDSGTYGTKSVDDLALASVLDLFRYNTDGTLDWTTGSPSFFSIDGGRSQLFGDSRFSTGAETGDGSQASHWTDNSYTFASNGCQVPTRRALGVMDPTAGLCETATVTALDLAAFDAIGWDVDVDVLAHPDYAVSSADMVRMFSAVPEPGPWLELVLGIGALGGMLRASRARVRFATAK